MFIILLQGSTYTSNGIILVLERSDHGWNGQELFTSHREFYIRLIVIELLTRLDHYNTYDVNEGLYSVTSSTYHISNGACNLHVRAWSYNESHSVKYLLV